MVKLGTERLQIRNFTAEDWQGLQEMIVQYQASESARFEPPWPTSAEEVQDIARWFASADNYLCVCLKPAGQIIGLVAIERRSDHAEPVHNLGYIFHPAYQGQGYASEACRAAMAYVFGQLAAAAIHSGTNPENTASIRLLTRLGLKQIKPGEFLLTRDEWQARDCGNIP